MAHRNLPKQGKVPAIAVHSTEPHRVGSVPALHQHSQQFQGGSCLVHSSSYNTYPALTSTVQSLLQHTSTSCLRHAMVIMHHVCAAARRYPITNQPLTITPGRAVGVSFLCLQRAGGCCSSGTEQPCCPEVEHHHYHA